MASETGAGAQPDVACEKGEAASDAAASQQEGRDQCAMHDALHRGDVLLEIFSRLTRVSDLASACLVCKPWLVAAADDRPWEALYLRQFGPPHVWEECSSFREQCLRAAGLHAPAPDPPLACLGAATLSQYDRAYGVKTLAVVYEPATGCLLRMRLVDGVGRGMDCTVAVEAVQLDPAPAAAAGAAGSRQDPAAEGGARQPLEGAAAPPPRLPVVCCVTPTGAWPPRGGAGGASAEDRGEDAQDGEVLLAAALRGEGEGEGEGEGATRGSVQHPTGQVDEAEADGGDTEQLTPEQVARELHAQSLLRSMLPDVACAAGGLLYLPAGYTGRGLAVWDVAESLRAARAGGAAAAATAAAAGGAAGVGGTRRSLPRPHWVVWEGEGSSYLHAAPGSYTADLTHPGRLLAAAADGRLAVSACDRGVLAFWRGAERVRLGSADISRFTNLPVVPPLGRVAAASEPARHKFHLAVCEASGVAAVMLASPLAPFTHLYRATPAASAPSGTAGSGNGVGQLLRTIETTSNDGLALFRGNLLILTVLASDVLEARFGGSGGSSTLITVNVTAWPLPEQGEQQRGEDVAWPECTRLYSSRRLLEHPRTLVLGSMKPTLTPTEDMLLLPVPRNVGGRQPHHHLLALQHRFGAAGQESEADGGEDGGMEEEGGAAGEGPGGEAGGEAAGEAAGERKSAGRAAREVRGGLRRGFMVLSEEGRLPWVEVVEDAGAAVVCVVPARRHLALLGNDGRLRLWGLVPA